MSKNAPSQSPPRWSLKLLRLFVRKEYLEEIEGDMEELFIDELEQFSVSKARRRYNWQMLKLLRPSLIYQNFSSQKLSHLAMLKHHFRVSFKHLVRDKAHAIMNITGLTVALACCIHLMLFIGHERSYDDHFKGGDDIYRLALNRSYPTKQNISRNVPHTIPEVMAADFPEVEKVTTFAGPFRNMLISYETEEGKTVKFNEEIVAADAAFPSFFNLEMILGDAQSVLIEPVSMILSESAAKKHFGTQNPVGKTIRRSRDHFKVTGVFKDLPESTHLKFDFVMSITTIGRFTVNNYTRADVGAYLKLKPGTDLGGLESRFSALVDQYAAGESEQRNRISWQDYKAAGNAYDYFLVPLKELYLHPGNLGGFKSGGNLILIRILSAVCGLLLLLAVINFSNLTTAKLTSRLKAAGIRKVLGSLRLSLVLQVLIESFILCTLATATAVLLVMLSQPIFEQLSGKELHLTLSIPNLGFLIGFIILLTLFAGLYPALLLSGAKPISAMKGHYSKGLKGQGFRNSLVVLQFTISIGLVTTVLIMKDQIDFLMSKDLGYDQEQLLIVTGDFHLDTEFVNTYINQLSALPEVTNVAGSLSMPRMGIFWEEEYKTIQNPDLTTMMMMKIGDGLVETLDLSLLQGRSFASETHDSLSVLLNTSAVAALGLTDPIGQTIQQLGADGISLSFKVIGVIEDFHFDNLYNEVAPLVIQSNEVIYGRSQQVVIRLGQQANLGLAIDKIHEQWKQLRPGQPFNLKFADELAAASYNKEARLKKILQAASVVSLFVALLGLFALAALILSFRTKEIGIRKIVGASTWRIMRHVGGKFTLMVLLAFFIASPLAWWILENWWLDDFAYRITIGPQVMLATGAGAIILAWFTIGFQTYKAAATNPVSSLRNE